MKVSDILLDLATGDASVHDAYIQESMGQVKVSAAIYDAAKMIASLDDSERTEIVQEAADAGLPSDREGAINLIYESVEHELIGTCRHFYAEMAKTSEDAEKPTSPLKAIEALAKMSGLTEKLSATKEYSEKLASTGIKNKDIKLKDGAKFCKGSAAKKLTKAMLQGTSLIANAFGISTDALFDDDTVSTVLPSPVIVKAKKDEDGSEKCCLSTISSAIEQANKYLKDNDLSDSDYTENISKNDLASVLVCYFASLKASKFLKSKIDGKAEAKCSKAVKACQKKGHVSADADALIESESGVKAVNENLNTLNKNLIKAFHDSIDSFIRAAGDDE